jgi:hypothetical protein
MNGFRTFFWLAVFCVVLGAVASRCDFPENKKCTISTEGTHYCETE